MKPRSTRSARVRAGTEISRDPACERLQPRAIDGPIVEIQPATSWRNAGRATSFLRRRTKAEQCHPNGRTAASKNVTAAGTVFSSRSKVAIKIGSSVRALRDHFPCPTSLRSCRAILASNASEEEISVALGHLASQPINCRRVLNKTEHVVQALTRSGSCFARRNDRCFAGFHGSRYTCRPSRACS